MALADFGSLVVDQVDIVDIVDRVNGVDRVDSLVLAGGTCLVTPNFLF